MSLTQVHSLQNKLKSLIQAIQSYVYIIYVYITLNNINQSVMDINTTTNSILTNVQNLFQFWFLLMCLDSDSRMLCYPIYSNVVTLYSRQTR